MRLDGSASAEQRNEAARILDGMIKDIGKLLDASKPSSPTDTLNIIHDYVHDTYRYSYSERSVSFVNAVTTHTLNCEAISSIFYGIGKAYGLPLNMMALLAYPAGHVFISWELDGGKRILWEPLASDGETREYASEVDAMAALARTSLPVTTDIKDYSPIDVLASDCVHNARSAANAAALMPIIAEEMRGGHDEFMNKARELSPNNPWPYMRDSLSKGDRKLAIEKAEVWAGEEYARFIEAVWEGDDAIMRHVAMISSRLREMGVESDLIIMASLLRRQDNSW